MTTQTTSQTERTLPDLAVVAGRIVDHDEAAVALMDILDDLMELAAG